MSTLIGFETRKIIRKKSTVIAFVVLLAIQVLLGISGNLGSTYKNEVFVETHIQRNAIDRSHGMVLSGRAIDDTLLREMQEAYAGFDWKDERYWWSEEYNQNIRKYKDLENRLKLWGLGKGYSFDNMTEESLYSLRIQQQEEMWKLYELSEKEKEYWQEKDTQVVIPFIYEYASAYDSHTGMQGMYMTCMLMTFFIGISMVTVFSEEHTLKTDQLILSSLYGKEKVYFAKLMAGSMVVFGVNMLFLIILIAGKFITYGMEGFHASVQSVLAPWYAYPVSMGQVMLLMMALLLLSSIMVAVFAMLLAEVLKNSVGAMAVVVGLLFVARLVPIPPSLGWLSKAWNYLPINLLKVDEGFLDPRLVNLFGISFTSWQFAPVLYILLIGVMVFLGSFIYKRYQVSGR